MNDQAGADKALKEKQRAMWALGDYPALASELLADLGAILVEACNIKPRQRVLDVGTGAGNAAVPAAMMGARVVASDLTPEMFDAGRRQAADRGVELEWVEADVENLPFADGEFDVVMSCLGAMFAPHHQASADEMLRVCRPGGTLGLLHWTPEGFIGQMFSTMKPFAPPLPPGAQPAPLWGSEDHVRKLFGDRLADIRAQKRTVAITSFRQPEDFLRYFKSHYGPTISLYRSLSGDEEKAKALDEALTELAGAYIEAHGDTPAQMEWEYLLLTGKANTKPQETGL